MMRAFDILLSAMLLVGAIPLMLVIAIMTYAHDGGPALFRQTRVGRNGRPFTILKFRSMRQDDQESRSGDVASGSREDKERARARFRTTEPEDPRVTPVGRVLRKTHLDELPQVFNVLRGDMSLVGVRPDTPAQETDYSEEYWRLRHTLRPGITGPAQVMNTADGGMEGRRYWETVWIERHSLRLYFHILIKTVSKVLKMSSF